MVKTTVCIFDESTLFSHSGCKGGSVLAKSMIFPHEGHLLNTDPITFLLKFMCLQTKQRNGKISRNQYTKAHSVPGSLKNVGTKMRNLQNKKLLSSKDYI